MDRERKRDRRGVYILRERERERRRGRRQG